MKRSGSPAGCDTHDVFELGSGYPELVDEAVEVVTGPEALQHVGNLGAPVGEDGLTEGPDRVCYDLGFPVTG